MTAVTIPSLEDCSALREVIWKLNGHEAHKLCCVLVGMVDANRQMAVAMPEDAERTTTASVLCQKLTDALRIAKEYGIILREDRRAS